MRQSSRSDTLYTYTLITLIWFLHASPAQCAGFRPFENPGATAFALSDPGGNIHTLDDYRGKVVLVNFWASWCPPCITELPELQRLQQRIGDEDFIILAINVGEKRYAVRKFAKLISLSLPVLLDVSSELFKAWGAKTLPSSYLLDAEGKMRYRVQGNPGWEKKHTIDIIQQLRTDTDPDDLPQNTTPARP